jgi:ribonuclease T2
LRLLAAAAAFLLSCGPGLARDFDFYVLSLSWSPSYCAAEGSQADSAQCSASRPYAFVVHGLWPQYESGFPEFCERNPEWVPQNLVNSMLDLMPSKRLIVHEWKKHGTCTGLSAASYFSLLRDVRSRIKIPAVYENPESWQTVSPAAVEAEFRNVNPGMRGDGIAVTCDNRHLREVRICLTQDLQFRACPETDRRSCRRQDVVMPPTR